MADFCKQCSEELFGQDTRDLAYDRQAELAPGEGWIEICEGCGPTLVLSDGTCITDCASHHAPKEVEDEEAQP